MIEARKKRLEEEEHERKKRFLALDEKNYTRTGK